MLAMKLILWPNDSVKTETLFCSHWCRPTFPQKEHYWGSMECSNEIEFCSVLQFTLLKATLVFLFTALERPGRTHGSFFSHKGKWAAPHWATGEKLHTSVPWSLTAWDPHSGRGWLHKRAVRRLPEEPGSQSSWQWTDCLGARGQDGVVLTSWLWLLGVWLCALSSRTGAWSGQPDPRLSPQRTVK